jgi:hypothetical protein
MPFKKVEDERSWKTARCRHPEHNPPSMIVLPHGLWEWTCPGCGQVQHIHVEGPSWGTAVRRTGSLRSCA